MNAIKRTIFVHILSFFLICLHTATQTYVGMPQEPFLNVNDETFKQSKEKEINGQALPLQKDNVEMQRLNDLRIKQEKQFLYEKKHPTSQ